MPVPGARRALLPVLLCLVALGSPAWAQQGKGGGSGGGAAPGGPAAQGPGQGGGPGHAQSFDQQIEALAAQFAQKAESIAQWTESTLANPNAGGDFDTNVKNTVAQTIARLEDLQDLAAQRLAQIAFSTGATGEEAEAALRLEIATTHPELEQTLEGLAATLRSLLDNAAALGLSPEAVALVEAARAQLQAAAVPADDTPPELTVESPIEYWQTTKTPLLAARYSDNLSGIVVESAGITLDGVAQSVLADESGVSAMPSPLAEGAHSATFSVSDFAGNGTSVTQGFAVDTVAPVVTITAPAAALLVQAQPVVSVSASLSDGPPGTGPPGSGIDRDAIRVFVDGEDRTDEFALPSPGADPAIIAASLVLSEGDHELRVGGADLAGNAASAEFSFRLAVPTTLAATEDSPLMREIDVTSEAQTMALRVLDGLGQPIPDLAVRFDLVSGEGLLDDGVGSPPGTTVTVSTSGTESEPDSQFRAAVRYLTPTVPTAAAVVASLPDFPAVLPATFTLTIYPGPVQRFEVTATPASVAAGEAVDLAIEARDVFENRVDAGPHVFTGAVEATITGFAAPAPPFAVDPPYTSFPESLAATFTATDAGLIVLPGFLRFAAAGVQGVTVTAPSAPTITGAASVTITPAAPSRIDPDPTAQGQQARVTETFTQPFAVRITDAFGNPPTAGSGVTARFAVTSGDARFPSATEPGPPPEPEVPQLTLLHAPDYGNDIPALDAYLESGEANAQLAGSVSGAADLCLCAADDGVLFLATGADPQIRAIDGGGTITRAVGNGMRGRRLGAGYGAAAEYTGDGSASQTPLLSPSSLLTDAAGNLYFADVLHIRVWNRQDTPLSVFGVSDIPPDHVATIAGAVVPLGDFLASGPASQVPMFGARNLSFDAAGNLYYTLEESGLLRRITPAGLVETVSSGGPDGQGNPNLLDPALLPTDPAMLLLPAIRRLLLHPSGLLLLFVDALDPQIGQRRSAAYAFNPTTAPVTLFGDSGAPLIVPAGQLVLAFDAGLSGFTVATPEWAVSGIQTEGSAAPDGRLFLRAVIQETATNTHVSALLEVRSDHSVAIAARDALSGNPESDTYVQPDGRRYPTPPALASADDARLGDAVEYLALDGDGNLFVLQSVGLDRAEGVAGHDLDELHLDHPALGGIVVRAFNRQSIARDFAGVADVPPNTLALIAGNVHRGDLSAGQAGGGPLANARFEHVAALAVAQNGDGSGPDTGYALELRRDGPAIRTVDAATQIVETLELGFRMESPAPGEEPVAVPDIPSAFTVLADGTLLYVDSKQELRRWDGPGQATTLLSLAPTKPKRDDPTPLAASGELSVRRGFTVSDMAAGPNGRLAVLDPVSPKAGPLEPQRVMVLDPDGAGGYTLAATLALPAGVYATQAAFGPDGALYFTQAMRPLASPEAGLQDLVPLTIWRWQPDDAAATPVLSLDLVSTFQPLDANLGDQRFEVTDMLVTDEGDFVIGWTNYLLLLSPGIGGAPPTGEILAGAPIVQILVQPEGLFTYAGPAAETPFFQVQAFAPLPGDALDTPSPLEGEGGGGGAASTGTASSLLLFADRHLIQLSIPEPTGGGGTGRALPELLVPVDAAGLATPEPLVAGTRAGPVTVEAAAGLISPSFTPLPIPPLTIAAAVLPGPLDRFEVPGFPVELTAGEPYGPFSLRAVDAYDNLLTDYAGRVEVLVSGAVIAVLGPAIGGTIVIPEDPDGITVAGVYGITLRDAEGAAETALPPLAVHPGPLDHFKVAGLAGSYTAGDALALTITAEDAYGNTLTDYAGPATLIFGGLTLTLGPGGAAPFTSGVATLDAATPGNVITTAGDFPLSVTGPDAQGHPVTFTTDGPIPVAPSAATRLELVSGGDQAGYPGEQLPAPVAVRARDAAGNPVPAALIAFEAFPHGADLQGSEPNLDGAQSRTNYDGIAFLLVTLTDELEARVYLRARIVGAAEDSPGAELVTAATRSDDVRLQKVNDPGTLRGITGTMSRYPLTVQVTTPAGRPVSGYQVDFLSADGGGWTFHSMNEFGWGYPGFGFITSDQYGHVGVVPRFPKKEPASDGATEITARVVGGGPGKEVAFPMEVRYPAVSAWYHVPPAFQSLGAQKLHAVYVTLRLRWDEFPDCEPPERTEYWMEEVQGAARWFPTQEDIGKDGYLRGILYPEEGGNIDEPVNIGLRVRIVDFAGLRPQPWVPSMDARAAAMAIAGRIITIGPIAVGGKPVKALRSTYEYSILEDLQTGFRSVKATLKTGEYLGDGVSARPIAGNFQLGVPGERLPQPLCFQVLDARVLPEEQQEERVRVRQIDTTTVAWEPYEVLFTGPGTFQTSDDILTGKKTEGQLTVPVLTTPTTLPKLDEFGDQVFDENNNPQMLTVPAGSTMVYYTPAGNAGGQGEVIEVLGGRAESLGENPNRAVSYVTNLIESMHFIVLLVRQDEEGNARALLARPNLMIDSDNDGVINDDDDVDAVENPRHEAMRYVRRDAAGPDVLPSPVAWPGRVITKYDQQSIDRFAELRVLLDAGPAQGGVTDLLFDTIPDWHRGRIALWASQDLSDASKRVGLEQPLSLALRQAAGRPPGLTLWVEGALTGTVLLRLTQKQGNVEAGSDIIRLKIVDDPERPFHRISGSSGIEEGAQRDGLEETKIHVALLRHGEEWLEPEPEPGEAAAPFDLSRGKAPLSGIQLVLAATSKTIESKELRWTQRLRHRFVLPDPPPGVVYTGLLPLESWFADPERIPEVAFWPQGLPHPYYLPNLDYPFYYPPLYRLDAEESWYRDHVGGVYTNAPDGTQAQWLKDEWLVEGTPDSIPMFPGPEGELAPFDTIKYSHQFSDWPSGIFGLGTKLYPRENERLAMLPSGLSVARVESTLEVALVRVQPPQAVFFYDRVTTLALFRYGSLQQLDENEGWLSRPLPLEQIPPGSDGFQEFQAWLRKSPAIRTVE